MTVRARPGICGVVWRIEILRSTHLRLLRETTLSRCVLADASFTENLPLICAVTTWHIAREDLETNVGTGELKL